MSVIFGILSYLMRAYFYQYAFRKAKKQAIIFYLKTLQIIRKSMIFAILIFFTLQLMLFGFIGSLTTGVWLLPIEETETKLWILFGFFSSLFLLPSFALFILFSEKLWLKMSGAEEALSDQTGQT